jgi:hypothetical protein
MKGIEPHYWMLVGYIVAGNGAHAALVGTDRYPDSHGPMGGVVVTRSIPAKLRRNEPFVISSDSQDLGWNFCYVGVLPKKGRVN